MRGQVSRHNSKDHTYTSLNSGISKQDDRKHAVRREIQKR